MTLGLRKKGKSKLEKRQTKRQSNGFSRKYRTFYVNVLQGGNTLVRWVKYLSVGATNMSVGAKYLSVGLPFCCLFSPGIFEKRLGLFSGGLMVSSNRQSDSSQSSERNRRGSRNRSLIGLKVRFLRSASRSVTSFIFAVAMMMMMLDASFHVIIDVSTTLLFYAIICNQSKPLPRLDLLINWTRAGAPRSCANRFKR